MSVAPPNTQGIRSININNLTSIPPHPAEVVYVDIYTDRITKQKFILWEDIRLAFHNALHSRHKARIVPFMKDDDFNTLKSLRIAIIPGEILDIIVGRPQDTTPPQQQTQQQRQRPSVLKQIKLQAAYLPPYNPLSTLRSLSSIQPSISVLNSRFEPARSNFARAQNTRQLDDAAVRARNKELARKYAKEAMTKIAAKMDLDALYTMGDGAPEDFWKSLDCYLKAVRQSHAHAQFKVGDLFMEGQDVSKDSSVALGWYMKAAFQGDTNAQRKLEALRRPEFRKTPVSVAHTDSMIENQGHISNYTDIQSSSKSKDS
ncbi:hypothetical protein BGZ47_011712 [Haplosporangium gracile]|nr:hypothetical protein BGZ47_011712 [Haplosporangium gracile]